MSSTTKKDIEKDDEDDDEPPPQRSHVKFLFVPCSDGVSSSEWIHETADGFMAWLPESGLESRIRSLIFNSAEPAL